MGDNPTAFENCAPASERTDLERRVLTLERMLQSLIAHTAESGPRCVDRFRANFVEPMQIADREDEAKDADARAEDFISAITRTIDASGVGVVASTAFMNAPTPSPSIGNVGGPGFRGHVVELFASLPRRLSGSYSHASSTCDAGFLTLGLHLPMAQKQTLRIGGLLPHPILQHILASIKIPIRLRGRYAAFPRQLHRFELELAVKCLLCPMIILRFQCDTNLGVDGTRDSLRFFARYSDFSVRHCPMN